MSRQSIETITCDRCGKEKKIIDGKNEFDKSNIFHFNVTNPTNIKDHVDLCHDCFKTLKNVWTSFIIGEGF